MFGGTSNALDFLPLDRSGNRRFIPVMVYPEQAEVHILEDEAASRAYIEQMWAEAMEIYRSGRFKLAFSPTMQRYLKEHQRDFMPEDTKACLLYTSNSEWQNLQPQPQQELKNTMNAMQPPQSIEEIKAGLETTEKGGVRQSIRNCLTVFQRDPLLSGAIAYNILTDRKDIIKPIGFHRESTALNDTDMKYLLLYLEETYGLTNEKKIDNAIGIVANENKYHPIRDYLNTLVSDGTERIRFCVRHFLGADADDYT